MTPIDLLVERLAENGILHSSDIAEANELFKQQIIDAHIAGFYSPPFGKSRNGEAKQYYNKTFKNTK
jgi:hypothetical protein